MFPKLSNGGPSTFTSQGEDLCLYYFFTFHVCAEISINAALKKKKKKSYCDNFSLHALPFLLKTEAGPAAQFSLLLGKIISSRTAGSRLQDVVHLQANQHQNNDNNNNNNNT